jgi:hypothetical protein
MVAEAKRQSIFHFSFDISHLPSQEFNFGTRRQMASRPPRRHRLESGLVRLAQPGGTSALSKRCAEKAACGENGVLRKRRAEKNSTRDIPGPMTNEKCQMRNGK